MAGLIDEAHNLEECNIGGQWQKKKFIIEVNIAQPGETGKEGRIVIKRDNILKRRLYEI